jgi:hypothetical protein
VLCAVELGLPGREGVVYGAADADGAGLNGGGGEAGYAALGTPPSLTEYSVLTSSPLFPAGKASV